MAANPTTTATLELNAVDNVTAVIKNVKSSVTDLASAYGKLKEALGLVAGGFTIGYFATMIQGALEGEAALLRLSERTGNTVEALSSLQKVAKLSNTEMDSVATGMQKLAKAMAEAEAGTGKAGKVFDVLGISVRDATTGALRPTQAVMQELGQKLMAMTDQTLALAFAQETLGKRGAELLPFLYELARAGDLQAKVTTEQALRAKEFEDNLVRLKSASTEFWRHLANDMLPTMSRFLQQLIEAKKIAGGTWTGAALMATVSGDEADDPGAALEKAQRSLEALRKTQAELAQLGGFQRWWNKDDIAIVATQLAGMEKRVALFNALVAAQNRMPAAISPPIDVRNPFADPKAGAGAPAAGYWTPEMEARYHALVQASKELEGLHSAEAKAAQDALKEAERLNAAYDAQAETVLRLIDPTRQYYEQIAKLDDLVATGKITFDQATEAIAKYKELIDKALNKGTKDTDDIARQLGLTFESAFERAITHGAKFRDVLRGIYEDIAKIIARKTITEPLGAAVSDFTKTSGLSSWFSDLFGGAHAEGGAMPPNTWNLVGEQGPEMVWSGPGGGNVIPNGALGGGGNYFIDARGADRTGLARLAAAIARVNGSIEQRAVAAQRSYARSRGIAA